MSLVHLVSDPISCLSDGGECGCTMTRRMWGEKNDEVGVVRSEEQTHITGKLINNTALHSFQFNGTMENRVCKIGIYSKARCNAMDKETA